MAQKKIKQFLNQGNVIAVLIVIAILGYFITSKLQSKEKIGLLQMEQSVAILPFANLSKDKEQAYFSDGFSEGILNSLARVKGMRVPARTSSFIFRESEPDIKDVGKRLDVSTVLKGSVLRRGDSVLITAQLINVKDDARSWSDHYEEKVEDIFALQDKIATAIAEKLEISLLEKKQQPVVSKPNPNKDAYELYLKGRSYWNLRTAPDLKKGIDFFQQAIKFDSLFAPAYSGIADCYTALGYGSYLPPKEAFPKALEAATKALELDSTLADPHASLGFCRFYYDWDWEAAEQEFRTSIALNPNYALAYDWYGYYLTAMKRYDEAEIIFQKAVTLDPLSVPINTDIGFSSYYRGDYDMAMKALKASLQMNPKFPLAHIWLGRTYQLKKMYPEAIKEYKNAVEFTAYWPVALAQIGNAYGVSGNKAAAQIILDTLISLSSKKFVTSYGVALVYMGLGEKDKTFVLLNKAYDERSHWLVWLRIDPRWAPLRADKRYIELVNKVGLPY